MPPAASRLLVIATIALLTVHGTLMATDELVFHRARGLSPWERWGHPVDSLFFGFATVVAGFTQPSTINFFIFCFLSVASSLIVTKDEWVHTAACAPMENWLHALLFILHGPLLIALGILWMHGEAPWLRQSLPVVVGLFCSYQLIYWLIFKRNTAHVRLPK